MTATEKEHLRIVLAALAMQSLLRARDTEAHAKDIAKDAFVMADALLEEAEKPKRIVP